MRDSREIIKKTRSIARNAFSRACKKLEAQLAADPPDLAAVQVSLSTLNQKADSLAAEEQKFLEALLNSSAEIAEIDEAAEGAEEYTRRWLKLQQAAESCMRIDRRRQSSGSVGSEGDSQSRRRFRLPKLELKTFNGDIDQWLSFWSSFIQIHEDDDLSPEDKFQYLIQCMEENSRAREVVESFPPTAGNYPKENAVINSAECRSGGTVEIVVAV
ncbi:hypothetical protein M514_27274 [Trichuris suis]|uniref:Uncharacterized protein n=1 Tax=Trichuris suis TaxID=68888 RepID=A0A085MTM4_9BILA|nr:hypothetical protein M514_27274 [Trichuris suis]